MGGCSLGCEIEKLKWGTNKGIRDEKKKKTDKSGGDGRKNST